VATNSIGRRPFEGDLDLYIRNIQNRLEAAALETTKIGARRALTRIRSEMEGAGLGRLGNALGSTSDKEKGRGVRRYPNGGFSASGVVFIRSGSDRSRGAIEAYTEGADILPVRSRWLWIPTDQIPRIVKKKRMTPELYNQNGYAQKIGPLVMVKSINGNPLLVVKTATFSSVGKLRSARAHLKSGKAPKGQRTKEFIVAFIGIPRTSRAARIDVPKIMQSVADELPELFNQVFGRY
jgi:hypothetical protein